MECYHSMLLLLSLCCAWVIAQGRVSPTTLSSTKRFHFKVEWKMVTRLCSTKPLLTVNGEYPGPNIMVQEGDEVEIVVTNGVAMNTTIHGHGVKQVRSGWADGPAYITQCPYKATILTPTSSESSNKGAHYGGMPISLGKGHLFMGLSSSTLDPHIHFLFPSQRRFPSC